jgi:4-amino-4-deoxy-L-arabinose transferase-like glycosyltransferase
MPESLVFLFYILALYLFQKWLDSPTPPLLVLAGMSTALAILVKPTSIHIGLVFLLLLLQQYGWTVWKRRDLWFFALICLLPALLWYLHARNLYLTYGNTFGVFSGGDSKFGDLRFWLRPSFYIETIKIDLRQIFALGGAPLFLFGLMVSQQKHRIRVLLFGVIAIILYYLIVARYVEFAYQYHIYLLPYAALGFGLGLEELLTRYKRSIALKNPLSQSYLAAIVVCLIAMVAGTGMAYNNLIRSNNAALIQCAYEVRAVVPHDSSVIISTVDFARSTDGIENNYQEPIIFYFSHRYGWSLPAEQHTPEQVDAYVRLGASYFVIYSEELLAEHPTLSQYLPKPDAVSFDLRRRRIDLQIS